jgi:hypothetical protein
VWAFFCMRQEAVDRGRKSEAVVQVCPSLWEGETFTCMSLTDRRRVTWHTEHPHDMKPQKGIARACVTSCRREDNRCSIANRHRYPTHTNIHSYNFFDQTAVSTTRTTGEATQILRTRSVLHQTRLSFAPEQATCSHIDQQLRRKSSPRTILT